MAESDLPHYIHTVEVWLDPADELDGNQRQKILITALFQWMRAGEIIKVKGGFEADNPRVCFDVRMTCPPHDLQGSAIYMRISNARREPDT